MDRPRLLSGHELVARGITKIDASLPEIGLKDVVPNGSWLEQKQMQSALEARKHIIEVERIEKSGVLSHAKWREELMLAEVTRNVGGHWQYFGHNIGKQLFLKPEEALFLIEVNCLRLTYNDVPVSMQQAYSLLLRSKISLLQYKVYASLSRIGYKVYRHEDKKVTEYEKKINMPENPGTDIHTSKSMETEESKDSEGNKGNEMEIESSTDEIEYHEDSEQKNSVKDGPKTEVDGNTDSEHTEDMERNNVDNKASDDIAIMDVDDGRTENGADCDKTIGTKCLNTNKIDETAEINNGKTTINEGKEEDKTIDSDNVSSTEGGSNGQDIIVNSSNKNGTEIKLDTTTTYSVITTNNVETKNEDMDVSKEASATNILEINCVTQNLKPPDQANKQQELYHQLKIKSLENRKLRSLDVKNTEKCFEKVPDVSQKQIVTVDVPEEKYIPRNVFLNNISYVLNLDSIKSKIRSNITCSTESRSYTNEEVNGDHIKRIKAIASGNTPVTNHPPLFPNNRFNRLPFLNFWRPNTSFFPYNFIFQRPFLPNNFFPRFRVFSPRPPLLGMYPRFTSFQPNEQRSRSNDNKKRRNSATQKEIHLEAIKHLAMRLRHLVQSGNTQQPMIDSLQRLINTFNTKYNMRMRLTDNFDLFNDETIVETITLDEEEEPVSKKAKTDDDNKYKENFNKLKQLALKLKGLESKEEVNSRHRRAFSNLIKKFNKFYNADAYFNSNFEVIDRKFINLDSSSDSDCVIEETAKFSGSKKLKNPFNILKRLSKKQVSSPSSNSKKNEIELTSNKYSTITIKSFDKNWLPSEDDFGRAEIFPKHLMNSFLLESRKEEFLFEFLNNQPYEFDNWVDIKLSFLKSIEETNVMIENDIAEMSSISSLIGPDDCMGMPSVLKKLSIISTNKEVDTESNLKVDFEVYNRDVQNFRKSSRPKPHFRVICVSESASFPSRKEVASVHSKYEDNISIVFAVVGVGSISYLQINPIDLPVYIPSNDFLE